MPLTTVELPDDIRAFVDEQVAEIEQTHPYPLHNRCYAGSFRPAQPANDVP